MGLVAGAVDALYRVLCLLPRRRSIVFLSRQSERPFDFALLEPSLAARFPDYEISWCCVPSIGRLGPALMLRQLLEAATASLCLVDGYVPAVSLPRRHRCRVVQVWHAPGAIKRFGYQSLDTPAGRTSRQAASLRMHRGYDLVVAGMPGAVGAFSEAFDVPAAMIRPLGLPRVDYLLSDDCAGLRARRYARADSALAAALEAAGAPEGAPVVLYAPTFRKGNADERWLEHSVGALRGALAPTSAVLVVAGHPLEHDRDRAGVRGGCPVAFLRGTPTIDLLHLADYVVTDYSTVAFEAGYASRRVLFYVPDIEEYRVSPGLNIDPLRDLPTVSFTDAAALASVVAGERAYDAGAFAEFMGRYAQGVGTGAVKRIVDALAPMLEGPSEKGERK